MKKSPILILAPILMLTVQSFATDTAANIPAAENLSVKATNQLTPEQIEQFMADNPTIDMPAPEPIKYKNTKRPAKLISLNNGEYLIENIRWGKVTPNPDELKWETVIIRPDLIKQAFWGVQRRGVGHVVLVFSFEPGGMVNSKGENGAGLVVSLETRLKANEKYSARKGMGKNFLAVWNLTEWTNHITYQSEINTEAMYLYRFTFPPQTQKKMLVNAIMEATADHSGEYYNTWANGCSGNAMRIVNSVLPISKQLKLTNLILIMNPKTTIPVVSPVYLKHKGIVGGKKIAVTPANYKTFNLLFPETAETGGNWESNGVNGQN